MDLLNNQIMFLLLVKNNSICKFYLFFCFNIFLFFINLNIIYNNFLNKILLIIII